MSNHLLIEVHESFRAAAHRAKSLSETSGTSTSVRRADFGWGVFGDENLQSMIYEAKQDAVNEAELAEEEIDDETWRKNENAKYAEHEVLGPLREEFLSDLNDHARSVEDGWMYED